MQDNLRLIIWTIIVCIGMWFMVSSIDLQLFLHMDAETTGNIPMNITDIGTRCGEEYANSSELIYYKINSHSQIIYRCPQGLFPISQTVPALATNPDVKKSLMPAQPVAH